MTDDPIGAQIANLDEQIAALRKERGRLAKMHGVPRVEPVQVYWRYHHEYREPYDGMLEEAYRSLEYMADDGQCSPEGVEVGGVLHSMDDLRDQFEKHDRE